VDESDRAVDSLRALLERDPDNVAAAAPLIAALIGTLQWDEALSIADEMAKQAPRDPLPAFYEGQILVAQGNLAKGAEAFGKALAIDPRFVPALYYRANVSAAASPSRARR
jgi:predicted Zn-dependent protease